MNFIYAESLREKFDVTGHFYNLNIATELANCHSDLRIKKKTISDKQSVDAVIYNDEPWQI
jgi:hypothetical protein